MVKKIRLTTLNIALASILLTASTFAAETLPGCQRAAIPYYNDSQNSSCLNIEMFAASSFVVGIPVAVATGVGPLWLATGAAVTGATCIYTSAVKRKWEKVLGLFMDAHDCVDLGECNGNDLIRFTKSLKGTSAEGSAEDVAKKIAALDRPGEPCGLKDGESLFPRGMKRIRNYLIENQSNQEAQNAL